MAFNNTAVVTPFARPSASAKNKPDAYINVNLPSRKGTERKLGFIGLKKTDETLTKFINWLSEDPTRISRVAETIQLEYHSTQGEVDSQFDLPTDEASSIAPPTSTADSWKSQGIINFWLPNTRGGRTKLGIIGLKANRPAEAALLAWLDEDPARVGQIQEKMILDFNLPSEEGTGTVDFDIY